MDDDLGISSIEELDIEARPANTPRSYRWELILGLALIVGVLAWAGWLWRQQENAKSHYQSAEKAESTHDWDTARSEYLLAASGNFRDARIRAGNASDKIAERDRIYETVKDEMGNGQWIEALRSLDALKEIQPNYRDSAALAGTAKKIIYSDALGGSVASRPDAKPPGLYYGSPDGWVWLQGSDRWSAVRGSDASGDTGAGDQPAHVIFDVPGPGWSPPASIVAALSASDGGSSQPVGLPNLKGRRLVVATLGSGKPVFQPLNFDPTDYTAFVASGRGVWAVRSDYTRPAPVPALPYAPYSQDDLAFQALGSLITTTVDLSSANSTVLALDPTGRRMLFAQWDTPRPTERADLTELRIYLATPTGRIQRMVYSFHGGLATAQISPDGNYALLRTYAPTGGGTLPQEQQVVLLNLQRYSEPRVLARTISKNANIADSEWSSPGGATFITHGKLAGLVLTVDWSGGSNVVRLIDPTREESSLLEVTINEPVHFLWASSADSELTLFLGGMGNFDGETLSYSHSVTNSVTMVAVTLGATLSTRIAHFSVDGSVAIRTMASKGNTMLYELEDLENLASSSHRILYSLSTLPLAALGTRDVSLKHIYSEITNLGSTIQGAARLEPNWYQGPGLLAYVRDGVLHARSYDDPSLDVALEAEGPVTALYDWTAPGAMDTVR